MSGSPPSESERIKARIAEQISAGQFRFTLHAHQEMAAEGFSLDDVLKGLASGELLENYRKHNRGGCALLGGTAPDKRPIHIVCTTEHLVLIVVTVYEPKPPKWLTPTQRNR